ncbi:MAG: pseudouridine-5'-phosphate glycosidase [Anaerolineales bacterium]|nr:pseudouridine-5'-phosphate glycosidase [Anaerolineales bacterium]
MPFQGDIPLHLSPEVRQALAENRPVVALESTVITHGLPWPENFQLAQDMEATLRQEGATSATVGVIDGEVHVGLSLAQLERLAAGENQVKISTRDIAPALVMGKSGGTTVAATAFIAHKAGMRIFATGGIGGVHRVASGQTFDISADLPTLAQLPMLVVCAGAKSILDLPATLEVLETSGVPVVGYRSDEFPAFFSIESGLKTSTRVESPAQAARLAQAHWGLGMRSAVLVVNPPPAENALPHAQVEAAIQQALAQAEASGVRGQEVTPFLLGAVKGLTGGASLQANLALLLNNARLAAQIACAW